MSSELVPLPAGPGAVLPTLSARNVVKAWLDGRCQNTWIAYVRDIRHFAKYVKARSSAAAIEQL
jgi:hypothetical protein